jgi:hypothetical protein
MAPRFMGYIAKATLRPEFGETKLTDGAVPLHTTWWFVKSLDVCARCALFTVVEPSVPA